MTGCRFGGVSREEFATGPCDGRAEVKVEATDPEGLWPDSLAGEMCMRHGKLIESRADELSRGKVSIKLKPIRNREKKNVENE